MRKMVILRGVPGSGKSSWVSEHGLRRYTLCADDIRLLYSAPKLTADGGLEISDKNEEKVWNTLFELLDTRMKNGEFVIIDATNVARRDISRYKEMAAKYRYRMYCIDFSDVTVETAKEQNKKRESMKVVPDEVIDKMQRRLQNNQELPSGITRLKPDEFESLLLQPIDLSSYQKIHHIGDIHGCYTALMSYLSSEIRDDEYYIFLGDYIDRGLENPEVLRFLFSIMDRPNVLFLEGNHERWLNCWANEEKARSNEFESRTRPQLEKAGIKKKEARRFYRKLAQCAYYQYHGQIYFVTHGGVSNFSKNPVYISAEQMIHGVGGYSDVKMVEENFAKTTSVIQIHAHRNQDFPIHSSEQNYNLEGGVDRGGCLRALEISKEEIKEIEIPNPVYRVKWDFSSVHSAIHCLRNDNDIKERKFGNISSFNFNRDAFNKKRWNHKTITARGLYINTKTEQIVCRGYNKFFAVDEMENTTLSKLKENLVFPVQAYVKENGFLGLISYDQEKNDLFITTKSDPNGDYANWLRILFQTKVGDDSFRKIKKFLKENPYTMLFECVDWANDPHIIDYERNELYLLDIVKNDLTFSKLPYEEVKKKGMEFGLRVKELAFSLKNWKEFETWYQKVMEEDYRYDERHIEGFVLEDMKNFMFKVKLPYYKKWKHRRSLVWNLDKLNLDGLDPEDRDFIRFVREEKGKGETNFQICHLRKLYENR